MKKIASIIVVACSLLLLGCGDKKGETAGYSKEDFKKTAPPAGFINNAPKGPASAPPPAGGN